MKQVLEAMESDTVLFSAWTEKMIAARTALRAALAASVPHGCHVDLDHGMKPDGCVLDDGRPENCIYAKRLLREGKDKTACEYWQPIEVTR